jgi:hypothetical protein
VAILYLSLYNQARNMVEFQYQLGASQQASFHRTSGWYLLIISYNWGWM